MLSKNLLFHMIFFVYLSSTQPLQGDWSDSDDMSQAYFRNLTPSCNLTKNQSRNTSYLVLYQYTIVNFTGMTICSIGMLCNLLLILVIIIDPLVILHRGAWITILNLSFADFLACGSQLTNLVALETNPEIMILDASSFLWMLSVGASFIFLGLLTIQIYVIIKFPVKSRIMLTRKRVLISCTIVWVIAVGMGVGNIGHIWLKDLKVVYIYIANIAVLEIIVVFQIVTKIFIVFEILSSRPKLLKAEIQDKKQKHVAKTVIILNVILFVTAFPYFLAKQIEYLHRLGYISAHPLVRKGNAYYEPVALLNFISNPLLYSLRFKDYRRSLLALLKFSYRKRYFNGNESHRIATSLIGVSSRLEKMELTNKL